MSIICKSHTNLILISNDFFSYSNPFGILVVIIIVRTSSSSSISSGIVIVTIIL